MKKQLIPITLLSITAFISGCDNDKTTSQQLDKVKTETKEAAQDMNDYTYAQKDEFVKSMQKQ